MQPAGYLVRAAIELAARMQHRMHHFERVALFRRMGPDRDSAPIVLDRYRVVAADCDINLSTKTRQCLIDRIIDNLRNQMMQPALCRVPDIHSGPLAHCLQPLQYPDRLSPVIVRRWLIGHKENRAKGPLKPKEITV